MTKKSFWRRFFCSHPAYRTISSESLGKYESTYKGCCLGKFTLTAETKQCIACGDEYITETKIWED